MAGLWGVCTPALGQVFVGPGEDYETLSEALFVGEVDIVLRSGSHVGGGRVSVPGTVISGEVNAVVLGSGSSVAQLDVVADNVTIQDLVFNGSGPGQWAVSVSFSSGLTLRNVEVHDAVVDGSYSGGAVLLQFGSAVTIEQSVFTDNEAPGGGALVVAGGSSATVVDSDFIGNRSTDDGGAILVVESGSLSVTNTTFQDNVAVGEGGAIAAPLGAQVTLTDVEFSGNLGFGTVALGLMPVAAVSGATFDDNPAGGLTATDVFELSVSDSWFCGGGGVTQGMYVTSSCDFGCTVSDSVFVGHDPGAMRFENNLGAVTVRDAAVIGNNGSTGAAVRGGLSNLNLERLLVGLNTGGPALYAVAGVHSLQDVRVFDNLPSDVGGQLGGSGVIPIAAPPLAADTNRCGTAPAELACDPVNQSLFDDGIGPSTVDADQDGVPARCDCNDDDDMDMGWEPCEPTETGTTGVTTEPPVTTTPWTDPPDTDVTRGEDPILDPIASNFLLGGGGCGCSARASGDGSWGEVLVGALARRR